MRLGIARAKPKARRRQIAQPSIAGRARGSSLGPRCAPLQWPAERGACFLVAAETVDLLEGEFLFAAGLKHDAPSIWASLPSQGALSGNAAHVANGWSIGPS